MKKSFIIAFGNRKGGVAKTTSVATLAAYFAKRGFRVLVVDLDSQASLTSTFLKVIPYNTVTDIFDKMPLPVIPIRENLDLVAADKDLVAVEKEFSKSNNANDRMYLARAISKVKDVYDIILLDCPPSLSFLTINALSACDHLFVPMDFDQKSINGVTDMAEACYQAATPTKIDGIFFTMYNGRLKVTQKIIDIMRSRYGSTVMESTIRPCAKAKESTLEHTDLLTYAPDCISAIDYIRLGDEILRIVGIDNENKSKKA